MFDSPSYQTYAAPKAEPPSTMSLRDYFAGQALAGFAADPEASWQDGGGLPSMARCAYQWADAMLEAREVKP